MRKTQALVTGQPTAHAQTQDAIAAVAAFVRRAPLCSTAFGCKANIDSAFESAARDSMTLYNTGAGGTVTFSNGDGALYRTQGTNRVAIIPDSLTMKFQYLLSPSLTYTMNSSTESLVWLDAVPSESLAAIVAVKITASIERDAVSSVQSSVVRLRNSPKKVFTTN